MPKKFYRTIIQVEVLSEDPYAFSGNLNALAYDITDGNCSGKTTVIRENEELSGSAAATALIEQGSDPEFFGLNKDGEEI